MPQGGCGDLNAVVMVLGDKLGRLAADCRAARSTLAQRVWSASNVFIMITRAEQRLYRASVAASRLTCVSFGSTKSLTAV